MSGKGNGTIELTGEVVAADVVVRRFEFRLSNDTRITVHFSPEQEADVLNALSNHLVLRLYIKGIGERNLEGSVSEVSEVTAMRVVEDGGAPGSSTTTILDKIKAIFADVSDSEWEKVPEDLSRNIDHYLYGAPKADE